MKSREEIEKRYILSWLEGECLYRTRICNSTLGEIDFIQNFVKEDNSRIVLFFKKLSD